MRSLKKKLATISEECLKGVQEQTHIFVTEEDPYLRIVLPTRATDHWLFIDNPLDFVHLHMGLVVPTMRRSVESYYDAFMHHQSFLCGKFQFNPTFEL